MQTEPTDHQDLFDRIRSQRGVATLLSVAALSIGGVGLAACGEDEPVEDVVTEEPVTEQTPEAVEESPGTDVALPRLLENPEEFEGETVEVAGGVVDEEVDGETNSGAAFTIGETLEEDLLILPQSELTPEGITEDSVVTVRGTVVQVSPDLTEDEDFLFEDEGIDDAFLDDFDGEYAIRATEIEAASQNPIEDQNE